MILSDVSAYVTEKTSSADIDIENYVTTDSLLQNKNGRKVAQNLPPTICSLTKFEEGDILLSNIRPYLKKIWKADVSGACSADVLVFRAKKSHNANYLYSILLQDVFFDYVMKAPKGSKMPRGDQGHIMRFPIKSFSAAEEKRIGSLTMNIMRKLQINNQINCELLNMAKELYNYWFLQFDFPDKNGNPYKASGGKMVYNKRLKRKIPKGWTVCSIGSVVESSNGGDWGKDDKTGNYSLCVHCIKGANISALTNLTKRYINKNNSNRLLNEWDIVVEISGGSPVQSTGRSALITKGLLSRYDFRLICSNFCQGLKLKEPSIAPYFFYMWNMFYDNNIMFNYEGKTSGIKNFLPDSFMANYWVFPDDKTAQAFGEQIRVLFMLKDKNAEEISQLSDFRDELLPLLMNGQVKARCKI